MAMAAVWYGVIIGEMIYLGGEWIDGRRAKKRATMRLEMEQSRKNKDKRESRRRRHRYEKEMTSVDTQSAYPTYEEYDSDMGRDDGSRHRSRRYIQDRNCSSHGGRDRRIEYDDRHDDNPINRSQSYNHASSTSPNMDRSLVVSNNSRSESSRRTAKPQFYANLDQSRPFDYAGGSHSNFVSGEAAYRHLAEQRWYNSRQQQQSRYT